MGRGGKKGAESEHTYFRCAVERKVNVPRSRYRSGPEANHVPGSNAKLHQKKGALGFRRKRKTVQK